MPGSDGGIELDFLVIQFDLNRTMDGPIIGLRSTPIQIATENAIRRFRWSEFYWFILNQLN